MKAAVLALLIALSALAQQQQQPKIRNYSIGSDSSIPHIIYGGEWQTQIVITNTLDKQRVVPISFFGIDGKPLSIPFTGQAPKETINVVVPANGSVMIQTEEPKDTVMAWGMVKSSGCEDYCRGIFGHSVMRNRNSSRPDFETYFPFESELRKEVFLPFDNTNWFNTTILMTYVEDLDWYDDTTVTFSCRNDGGSRIVLDQFKLKRGEFRFFSLAEKYPSTIGARGTCDVISSQYGIILNGLRINPTNAFSAIYGVEK